MGLAEVSHYYDAISPSAPPSVWCSCSVARSRRRFRSHVMAASGRLSQPIAWSTSLSPRRPGCCCVTFQARCLSHECTRCASHHRHRCFRAWPCVPLSSAALLQVRVFSFATGKMLKKINESLDQQRTIQQACNGNRMPGRIPGSERKEERLGSELWNEGEARRAQSGP